MTKEESPRAPKFRIYPSIGVARLGNGPAQKTQVAWSPEVPGKDMFATDLEFYTREGKLKKMAQRFYIYECDDKGKPVRPIDPDKYDITWTVEVANKKPFWYEFGNCLDLSIVSENQDLSPRVAREELAPARSVLRRNPNVLNMEERVPGGYDYRKELVNRPPKVSVHASAPKHELGGRFPFVPTNSSVSRLAKSMGCDDEEVNLGTIEYDDGLYEGQIRERYKGTLIVYAGDGASASLNPSDLNTNFADNSNWYDDICDGRVTATLTAKDGSEPTKTLDDARSAAWLVTAPPNYAPQIDPLATMFDLTTGAAYTPQQEPPYAPSLSLVLPLMFRLYRMQWVNLGDFLAPSFRETIDQLTKEGKLKYLYTKEPKPEADKVREEIFALFRNPAYPVNNEPIIPSQEQTDIDNRGVGTDPLGLPYYPGDGVDYPGSPAQWFAIPPVLYAQLENWRDGKFDTPPGLATAKTMDDIGKFYQQCFADAAKEPNKQALLMTRAVLDTLYGGGFHPGVELTWPMRHNAIYAENELVYPAVLERDNHRYGFYGLREIRLNAADPARQGEIFFNDFGFQMDAEDIRESLDPTNEKHWLWTITPGDLTKWMGIPWQSDAGSCQAVFTEEQYPVPAWWAANLPVYVLPKASLDKLEDPDIVDDTKQYIYANRLAWLHTANTGFIGYHAQGGYTNGLISMVYQWNKIGVVTGRPRPKSAEGLKGIPEVLYVAFEPGDADGSTP
ncbi:MAG: LodA/GoxA family CTQ-dependent oxidase [Myxococcota bacterium]